MHPHTIKLMETNTNTPEAKQSASAGCHHTTCSASWLEKLGGFQLTVDGKELKGWVPDFEGGTHKCYLDANDCMDVAAAFTRMAVIIQQNSELCRPDSE